MGVALSAPWSPRMLATEEGREVEEFVCVGVLMALWAISRELMRDMAAVADMLPACWGCKEEGGRERGCEC